MLKELFIALTVNLDVFLAAVSYCSSGIRIPKRSAAVVCVFGSAVIGAAMLLSDLLTAHISAKMCSKASVFIIGFIGISVIFRSITRKLMSRVADRDLILKSGSFSLVIRLYLDDTAADTDNSKSLSVREAFALAAASSLDCAATGIGCGLSDSAPLMTSLLTLLTGAAAIILGSLTGKKISSLNRDLSWVGGVMLIILAFLA